MKNLTDITFVLDRSGSMAAMVGDVRGGWKTFVEQQKAIPGECVLSLVQFDDEYEPVFTAVPIQNVSPEIRFEPRGSTALRDAVGLTINRVGRRLRELPESERPNKVVIAVMTDGEENASKEFTQERLKQMVKHQTDQYAWEFLFLGANIDSFATAEHLGFMRNRITNYSYTGAGMQAGFGTVSNYTSTLRSTGVAPAASLSDIQAVNECKTSDDDKSAVVATR